MVKYLSLIQHPLVVSTQLSFLFSPRSLSLPGSDLDGICLLRTPEDANKIAADCRGKHVVVIGTSFIGEIYHLVCPVSIIQ